MLGGDLVDVADLQHLPDLVGELADPFPGEIEGAEQQLASGHGLRLSPVAVLGRPAALLLLRRLSAALLLLCRRLHELADEPTALLPHLIVLEHLVPHLGVPKVDRDLGLIAVSHDAVRLLDNPRGGGKQGKDGAQRDENDGEQGEEIAEGRR